MPWPLAGGGGDPPPAWPGRTWGDGAGERWGEGADSDVRAAGAAWESVSAAARWPSAAAAVRCAICANAVGGEGEGEGDEGEGEGDGGGDGGCGCAGEGEGENEGEGEGEGARSLGVFSISKKLYSKLCSPVPGGLRSAPVPVPWADCGNEPCAGEAADAATAGSLQWLSPAPPALTGVL
jgi:hypothetical protein